MDALIPDNQNEQQYKSHDQAGRFLPNHFDGDEGIQLVKLRTA